MSAIDWNGKYTHMAIVGFLFFIILLTTLHYINYRFRADIPAGYIMVFSVLVAGLGSNWLFRNVRA